MQQHRNSLSTSVKKNWASYFCRATDWGTTVSGFWAIPYYDQFRDPPCWLYWIWPATTSPMLAFKP